jgi:SSS family solute:Na+ symporter
MISHVDLSISIFYVVAIVGIGLLATYRKKKRILSTASNEYFLAGKTLRWPMIGLALFATNISCLHLVSLAQSGFDTGLLNGNFEWMAAFTLILLALFFVPFYIKSGVATLPDFLEKRYNKACRDWLTAISVISAVIIHIAFSLLSGGIVLKTLFGLNMYLSVSVIAALVAVYTIAGGLTAVVVTESIQTVVLVLGAIVITSVSWIKLGGWSSLEHVLHNSHAMEKLSMLRPANDPDGMPWFAIFLGYPVLGIWYWCADQTIVQRVLGAKNENNARVGALFCGFIKILPVFIFVLPGLLAYALMQKGLLHVESVTSISASGKQVVDSKGIYTLMITQLLPTGLIGILVAALLSGLMSQVAGALNSISTLISFDVFKRINPEIPDKKLVNIGRVSGTIALFFSILLLPILNSYGSLFNGLNDIIAHIAPPISCVFVLGVFWKKASAKSAQLTLWIGSILGVVVYTINKIFPNTTAGRIPFMMMAFYLFVFCMALQVTLSFVYPVHHTEESSKLYWKSPWEPLKGKAWKGLGNYKILSLILLFIMVILYGFFG